MSPSHVRVYRVGPMTPTLNAGPAADITATTDALIPRGRQTRNGALFASPTLRGAARWVRGREGVGLDVTVHAVSVPATTWCYPVRAWEDISWRRDDPALYWPSGVVLGEWSAEAVEDDGAEWEVLIDPGTIRSHRTVSPARVVSAADPLWREQTRAALRRAGRRARYGQVA